MRFFACVDKIVGVSGSLGVHLPVEDVTLKIVEVVTADYEFEQRTILYKDDITRAEIEAIVRQRCTIMSRGSTSAKNRNVGQALVANKPARRNRKQQGNGKGVAGKGASGGVAVTKTTKTAVRRMGRGSSTTCVTSATVAWSQDIDGLTARRKSSPSRRSLRTALVIL